MGNTSKIFETCPIMEREARKVQEKQYVSNSKEHVWFSNAAEKIDNKNNRGGMPNRMQSKE